METHGSILLVDDEETFRESTCRLLEREGITCQCARDADEAVAALQASRFDVLVADIRMPGNPDLRVVRAARKIDCQMPVVLVTGYPSTETAIRGIELSVMSYLTKPVDFDELLGHVKAAIVRSENRRALAAIRDRLRTCVADLETAESQLRFSGHKKPTACFDRDGSDSRRLSVRIVDVRAHSGEGWPSGNLCELLDCPQQPVHRQAIVETIEVLKKTKDSFKSKALAELRAKLELLLGLREGMDDCRGSCARLEERVPDGQ